MWYLDLCTARDLFISGGFRAEGDDQGYPKSLRLVQKSPEMNRSRAVHKSRYQVVYPTLKTRKVTAI